MGKLESIKGDYQITVPVESIDIARILRENLRDGSKNYVMIITDKEILTFFTKKFAKRLEMLDILEPLEVNENYEYGIFNQTGKSFVGGNIIRSIGFTHGYVSSIDVFDSLKEALDTVDHVEALIENKRFDMRKNRSTIKIVAGQ